jgi:hypothetical protein
MKLTKQQAHDLKALKKARHKTIEGLKKGIKTGAPTGLILHGLLRVTEVGDQIAGWEKVDGQVSQN